jgi:antirestriction protein ArdC
LAKKEVYLRLPKHLEHYPFGDMRLEQPFDRLSISSAHAFKKLARNSADDFLLAIVGPAQTTGDHAADVPSWLDERHTNALPCRRYGRRCATSCGSVDHHVEAVRIRKCERQPQQNQSR